jgi:hypothetical protein
MSLKEVVELYTGRKIQTIETAKDPHNKHYTAIKATFDPNADVVFFLYQDDIPKDRDCLEEVEFEVWPPTSNRKNMFKLENMNVSVS